jgi:hypothetical protein
MSWRHVRIRRFNWRQVRSQSRIQARARARLSEIAVLSLALWPVTFSSKH